MLLEKLHENHSQNKNYYIKPESKLSKFFGVNHYAGPIFYQINGFVEKNRGHFSSDLSKLIKSSQFRFLHRIFDINKNKQLDALVPLATTTSSDYSAIPLVCQTLELNFRKSLESLINRLENRQSYFVFCIKSNDLNKPMASFLNNFFLIIIIDNKKNKYNINTKKIKSNKFKTDYNVKFSILF